MIIKTGQLEINENREIKLDRFEGFLEKIVIQNSSTTLPTAHLTVTSDDGEYIINREIGSNSLIIKPRDTNKNEAIIIDQSSNQTNVSDSGKQSEKYYIDGNLFFKFTGFGKDGKIQNISIYYSGSTEELKPKTEIIQVETKEIEKAWKKPFYLKHKK